MKVALVLACMLLAFRVAAQDEQAPDPVMEEQIETRLEAGEAAPDDDDEVSVRLQALRRRPLNVNSLDEGELEQLEILTKWQVDQFRRYRQQFGPFISLYELQAVPGWDLMTIQKMLPFLSLSPGETAQQTWKAAWESGHGLVTIAAGRLVEKPAGYGITDSLGEKYYLGSRDKISIRYRFSYGNHLQWGFLAKKDAGEQLFGKTQRAGFDFYGFYACLRGRGLIRSLILGDFTINFGQGLTLWQKMTFSGNSVVVGIQRFTPTAQAHSSAGENNFQRGIAIGFQRKSWEATFFCSYRRVSANLIMDSISGQERVSALQTNGYHRTVGEMADRNCLPQYSIGSQLRFRTLGGSVGANAVYWQFSVPFKKNDEAYKLFAFQGRSLSNFSLDYSYTWQNLHAFGEVAVDNQWHKALLAGMLLSADPRVDLALFYRNISRAYQSINASAFTSNSMPVNEQGFYAGIVLRPATAWEISAYVDFSVFPWLKYRVNMPSNAHTYLLQINYAPSGQSTLYARFRNITSPINQQAEPASVAPVGHSIKKELQLHAEMSAGRAFILRQRAALMWFRDAGLAKGDGFLVYEECFYHPPSKMGLAVNLRLQYFETGGYDERIFVYESDLPYHFSIPFFYGKGWRYYLNVGGKIKWPAKKMRANGTIAWHIKWSQTIYPGLSSIGDGPDQTTGNHASDISLELSIPVR